jgi:hypothetical protein
MPLYDCFVGTATCKLQWQSESQLLQLPGAVAHSPNGPVQSHCHHAVRRAQHAMPVLSAVQQGHFRRGAHIRPGTAAKAIQLDRVRRQCHPSARSMVPHTHTRAGGACEVVHARWCMRGGAREVVHARWCAQMRWRQKPRPFGTLTGAPHLRHWCGGRR